jgi:glucan phosphoethanolaminetransferase (alkaline phosphatase superfamily)
VQRRLDGAARHPKKRFRVPAKKAAVVKTEAQRWGQTAVSFIWSATGTGAFAILSYVWRGIPPVTMVCRALAALCFVMLAIASITIVKWWIVIAKRNQKAKSSP